MLTACSASTEFTLPIGDADEVVVLVYPEHLLTRTAINPDLLEKNYQRRNVIRSSDTEKWKQFTEAVRSTKWRQSDRTGDYRWGLHIRSKSRERDQVYIDRKAGLAEIDGRKFTISGGLLKWLTRN